MESLLQANIKIYDNVDHIIVFHDQFVAKSKHNFGDVQLGQLD